MKDFQFPIKISSGISFDITMNECADDSPWVGDIRDGKGVLVDWCVVIAAVIKAQGIDEYSEEDETIAEAWLNGALQARLDFERERLAAL